VLGLGVLGVGELAGVLDAVEEESVEGAGVALVDVEVSEVVSLAGVVEELPPRLSFL
jgi:hypothetical protein